ncbi:HHL149Cp [Eremothecium sinecaudum]|uniref:Chromatin modification-related protein EAF3 n=1 Tax=Eremothecium sinecaudum TaxID=45286 RepID=A0A120K2U7_9SACH|nr:HHL149Cp [Eremothecium sinecaudum]AMD22621.1 HHL149Cp [Eremothecium sinecaudum]
MEFEIDGKCLCYHGPLLYEARVLRIYDPVTKTYRDKHNSRVEPTEEDKLPEDALGRPLWFVHYQGWKATWDEWVSQERIRPYNDENLALKKQLVRDMKEAAAAAKRSKSKGGAPSSGSSSGATSAKRERSPLNKGRGTSGSAAAAAIPDPQNPTTQSQKLLQSVLQEHQTPRILLRMPLALKSLLVDDWELITKDRKLLALPCSPSAEEILNAYRDDRSAQLPSPVSQTLLHEFVEGIRLYFDQALSHLLLYRLERPQFSELLGTTATIIQNDENQEGSTNVLTSSYPRPSTIYGGIHLIRLLSLMPELISGTTMDEKSCHTVVSQCETLLAWIANRSSTLIPNNYVNTSAQYEGVALGM